MNLNTANWLKPLLLLAGIALSTSLSAQPKLFTIDFTNQSGTVGSKDYTTGFLFETVAFGTYKLVVSADANGDRFFRFRNSANTQDRRPNADGDIIALNQNTAYTSIFDGAFNAFKITGTNTGYRYIFKTDAAVANVAVIEIQGTNVESVSSVSQSPVTGNVFAGQTVTVSATLSGSFSTGQAVWLRYSTNGFSTSTVVKMTGSGTSYSATIPASANSAGTTVAYYLFTSGDYGSISGSNADLLTINGNNNGGSNYSYTVQSWTTANPGNWSSAATWTANAVPSTTENLGAVSINHVVTMDQDALINGGTIGASGNLTVNSGSTLKTSNGLTNNGVFTVSGIFEITAGGYTNTGPVYTSGSTLRYNTGASYNRNAEWSSTTPHHVSVTGNTSVSLGTGASSFSTNGDLNIASGSTLTLNTISGTLTVNGDVNVSGTLTLSTTSGGDLVAKKNVTFNSGSTFNNSGRAVFFSGSTDQTLTNTANVALAYLVADNSGGNIILGTDLTLAGTTDDVLQLLNNNTIDLNGKTLTFSGNGGNILVGSAAGSSARTIGGSSGTVAITGTKTVVSNSSKTLTFGSGITVLLTAGMNFGLSLSTINGTLQINNGGFVSVNPPTYASGSVLKYNSGTTYGRNLEWSSTSGAGYPYHVQISNSTTVDLGTNGGTGTARQLAGNLTIDAGSTLTLATTPMIAALTVLGHVINEGSLTLSGSGGGDLVSFGDFTVGSAGTFTGNGRAVFFHKNGTQILTKTGGGTLTIPYILIGGSGNVSTIQLASGTNLTVTAPAAGNAVVFNSSSDKIDLNGNTLTVSAGAFSGSGTLTGSASSNLSLSGTGDAGTVNFTSGSRVLNNLTVNRTSSGKVTLGTNLSVGGTVTLTAGELALGSSTLTVTGTFARISGTLSSTSGAGSLSVTGTGDAGTVAFTTGANTLGTLSLDRTASGLLSLASNLAITSNLTLTNGNLDLNGNNIISLGSTGSISESAGNSVINSNGSGTGYIEATHAGGTALTANDIGSLGFLVTTSAAPGTVTIRRYHTQKTVSGAGALSVKRYFYVNLAGTNNGTAFQLNYNQTNDLNSLYENNLIAYQSADASSWSEETNGTGSLDATGNFYTRSGLSGFSAYYTLAEKFYSTTGGGTNWSDVNTWGGPVPPAGSSVTISHAVTLDVSPTIGSLILSSGSLDLGSNTLTFSDGARFTNNATFTPNSGTVVFSGSARIDGSTAPTFNVLTAGNGVISTFGNWSVTTFNKNTSTVSFRDAGNISSATSFYNVTFESGTRTLLANIDVEGTIAVDGGTLVTTGSQTLTLSGSNSQLLVNTNGTITGTDNGGGNDLYLVVSGGLATVGGTKSLSGDNLGRKFYQVTVNPGSTLALSRGILVKYNSFTVNGILQINSNGFVETGVVSSSNAIYGVNGSLIYNNGGPYSVTTGEWPTSSSPKNVTIQNNSAITLVASSPRTITGDLTLTSGTLADNGNTITVNKHVTGTSGIHSGSGKLLLSGGSTHSIGGVTLGNIELNDAAGASLNGATVITGTLTLTTGQLNISSQSLEIRNPLAGTATNLIGGTTSTLIAGGSSSGMVIPSSITALNHFSVTNTSVGGVTLSANLPLEGNLTIGSGSTLNDASFTITVKGDISNQGTHSGSGKVLMQGKASPAAITGSGVFGNLEFDDNDGFTISANPSVSGTLTMTNGNISTGSNTLTLGVSAAQTGTLVYSSGRIFGGFRRWFAPSTVSNVLFPIGIVTASALVDLSFTSAPVSGGTLRASFSINPAGQNGLPLNDSGYPITTTASSGYWTISAANGLSGGTYDLNLTAQNFGGILSYTTLRLIKRTNSSSPWVIEGTHVPATGSNSIPVVKRSGLTTFSDFTVASDAGDNSLPVELSEFSARQNGKKVILSWTTESETNHAGFFIYRLMDGQEPVKVSDQLIKPGTSSSSTRKSYSFPDEPALTEKKTLTYLIESIDLDGTTHLSGKTAVLEFQPVPQQFAVSQNYPNPFNPETRFTLSLPLDGPVSIEIFSVTGQKVRTLFNGEFSAGSYDIVWDGKTDQAISAASGLYWYRVVSKSGTIVKKMQLIR